MGWVLSSENKEPGADPFLSVGRPHWRAALESRADAGPGVVEDPMHVEKQHAREPGDLQGA